MSSPPTAADVARLAGCSESSVRNWTSRRHLLSPATATRIGEAVASLGYVPRPGRPRRVGGYKVAFEIPRAGDTTPNFIFDSELRHVALALWERGHVLLPFGGTGDGDGLASYEQVLAQYSPDAVLVSDAEVRRDPRLLLLESAKIPFVTIGRVEEPACSWVDIDLVAGLEEAVTHMAESGHARIAFLGFPHGENVADQEYRGYQRGLLLNRLPDDLHSQLTYQASKDLVEDALRGLLGPQGGEPSALIAACDEWALAALDLAFALEMPRLRAVAGIDDSPMATARRPHLTSLRQPTAALCRDAVVLIEELLDRPEVGRRQLLERPALQVRQSSSPGIK
jgi:LacI family transcriptional regulator